MAILELLAIAVGLFSASIGFSNKLYMLLTPRVLLTDAAYVRLMQSQKLEDRNDVQLLVQMVANQMKPLDTPAFAQYGLLRQAKDTVRLEMKVGMIEQGPNWVGIHPIYGYNSKGEFTFKADKETFYNAYRDAVVGKQQRSAFGILLIAFLIQLIAVFIKF